MRIPSSTRAIRPVPETEAILSTDGTQVWIGKGKRSQQCYDVFEFPAAGGRAFRLDKVNMATHYNVFVSETPGECSTCDCAGFEFVGRCKHVDAVAGLISDGQLADPRAYDPRTLPVPPTAAPF